MIARSHSNGYLKVIILVDETIENFPGFLKKINRISPQLLNNIHKFDSLTILFCFYKHKITSVSKHIAVVVQTHNPSKKKKGG